MPLSVKMRLSTCELTCKHVFQSIPIAFKPFKPCSLQGLQEKHYNMANKSNMANVVSLQNNSYPIYVLILSSLSIYSYPEAVMRLASNTKE